MRSERELLKDMLSLIEKLKGSSGIVMQIINLK
jgi:hypothetical protein